MTKPNESPICAPYEPAAEPDRKRLPYLVTRHGRKVLDRAILLRDASNGALIESSPESDGAALVTIVAEWLTYQANKLRDAETEEEA